MTVEVINIAAADKLSVYSWPGTELKNLINSWITIIRIK